MPAPPPPPTTSGGNNTSAMKKLSGRFRVQKTENNNNGHASSGTAITGPLAMTTTTTTTTSSPHSQSIKRPRGLTVCVACRRSKLRCDRRLPCNSCVRRDVEGSCSYYAAARAGKPAVTNVAVATGATDTTTGGDRSGSGGNTRAGGGGTVAEDRLVHLEGLVKQLMHQQQQQQQQQTGNLPVTPPVELHDTPSDTVGSTLTTSDSEGMIYVGATHWSSVLDDIHEIKLAITGSETVSHNDSSQHTLPPITNDTTAVNLAEDEIIFGSARGLTIQHILTEYLPEKVETDRCLATYFRGETYIAPYVHAYHFQQQYQQFWRDSINVNPLWLSVLFSICQMATMFNRTNKTQSASSRCNTSASLLHEAAGKCLVLGNYHRPQKFVIEALAMYGLCKNIQTLDPCREAGAILSMCVRMCYEMGYHRDPSSVGNFTAFEGEMRRRCWSSVKQMDLMVSFQLGLPSSVYLENCDAQSPRNLLDSDFDSASSELPAARPDHEATRLLWFIIKDKQMIGFSKVWRDALSFVPKTESEVLELENEIRRLHEHIPEVLRSRPVSESLVDPPFLIVTRLYINFIHQKSLCVLHRKYMAKGNLLSTQRCVEAATQLVSRFLDMYKEFAPGGQLQGECWMLSNFTMNDFLLGIMVLCQFVHLCRKGAISWNASIDIPTESAIVELLQKARSVCAEKSSLSKDAHRVTQVIHLTVNGSVTRQAGRQAQMQTPASMVSADADMDAGGYEAHAADSNKGFPPAAFDLSQHKVETWGWMDPFDFLHEEMADFDWNMTDAGIFS